MDLSLANSCLKPLRVAETTLDNFFFIDNYADQSTYHREFSLEYRHADWDDTDTRCNSADIPEEKGV